MKSFFRICRRILWRAISATAIAAAILVGVAKLVLPYAANYRVQVEERLAEYLGQPVSVGTLSAEWTASGPMFILSDVQLLDRAGNETELRFEQARLHYNIWSWARLNNRNPTTFTIVGTRVLVTRDEQGKLSVEGMAASEAPPGPGPEAGFLPWLVNQGNINLASWEISYREFGDSDMDITVAVQRLRLKNLGDRHFLSGSIVMPGLPDHAFDFGAQWTGMPADARDITIYLRGEHVPVSDLLARMDVQPVATLAGDATFELWTEWEERELRDVTGNISVSTVHLASNTIDAEFRADRMAGVLRWSSVPDGWVLAVDDLEFGADDHVWPAGALTIQSGPDGYDVGADYIRLDDVAAMLTVIDGLDPDLRTRLGQWAPRGALRALRASLRERDEGPWVQVSAQMDGIGFGPGEGIPGIAGLTGHLDFTSDEGTLDIYGSGPRISVPGVFESGLQFGYATGQVVWKRSGDDWHISMPELFLGNEDLDIHARADVFTQPDSAPMLDVFATVRDLDLRTARNYVPVTLLEKKEKYTLLEWLEEGPQSGHITSAAATLYGDLDDFPFKGNEGRFEINANVEGMVLDYHPEWPRAEQVDSELQFRGVSMEAEIRTGQIFDTEIVEGRVRIPDLTHAYLTLDGSARGPAANGLRFLRESPLNDEYGEHIAALKAGGVINTRVRLGVPLSAGTGRTEVDGAVSLNGNAITEKRWGFSVEQARGEVAFSDSGIRADGVDVSFRGNPSKLDLQIGSALTENPRNILEGRLTGVMPVETLLRDYETLMPLTNYVSGDSTWLIRLTIPEESGPDPNIMVVSSDLVGTRVDFPEPLAKAAETARPIEVVFAYPQGQTPIRLRYGDSLSGIFEMGPENLKRGTLHFGGGEPELLGEGLSATGDVDFVNAADWWSGFDLLFEDEETGETAEDAPLLRHISLTAKRLSLTGRIYDNVRFTAHRVDDQWQADVEADQAKGRLKLPARGARRNAVVMDLERLDYPDVIDDAESADVDPRVLPEMHLFAQSLTYAGCPLGEVRLETYPTPDGLQVGLLESSSDLHSIQATGDWNVSEDQEYSDFDITFTSESLGTSLDACNLPGVMKGGQTVAQIDAWWAGSPADFELARLNGQLEVSIGSGSMLDVDPGAGRMVGLFSVESLPRRLSLDFSDVLEGGFGFDSIEGTFRLREGNAYTDDIVVEAPSGTVLVSGRTGLAERDYDQEVTVKPKISGTLPIVAGLALGPPGAAVAFVFQNVLRSELKDMAAYRYSVTGPWDDPQIQSLGLAEGESAEADSASDSDDAVVGEQGGL